MHTHRRRALSSLEGNDYFRVRCDISMDTRQKYSLAIAIALLLLIVLHSNFSNKQFSYHSNDKSSASTRLVNDGFGHIHYLSKNTSAKCIDGSPPAMYIRPAPRESTNQLKWVVFFEGGGWCFTSEQCLIRASNKLGSSKKYPETLEPGLFSYYLSNDKQRNPMMYDWNMVYVRYCDGGSYAGDSIVKHKGKTLFFKGRHNRDETIKYLLNTANMRAATHVVLAGCSAGGLALFLGIDRMAQLVHMANRRTIVRGLSDSGFFLNYTSHYRTPLTALAGGKDEASVNGMLDYARTMRQVFRLMQMNRGTDVDCLNRHRSKASTASVGASANASGASASGSDAEEGNVQALGLTEESKCVFAHQLAPHVQTPMFLLQPQYDQWQILHVLGPDYTAASVVGFGKQLRRLIDTSFMSSTGRSSRNKHGLFIDSCAHHCTGCSVAGEDTWHGPRVLAEPLIAARTSTSTTAAKVGSANTTSTKSSVSSSMKTVMKVTAAQAFQRWFEDSLHVDDKTSSSSTAHVYLQDRPFPCNDCCRCRVYNRTAHYPH